MPEVTVILEACEPMELLRYPFDNTVWIRNLGVPINGHWEEIEIRGEWDEVWKFIDLHWDENTATAYLSETLQ